MPPNNSAASQAIEEALVASGVLVRDPITGQALPSADYRAQQLQGYAPQSVDKYQGRPTRAAPAAVPPGTPTLSPLAGSQRTYPDPASMFPPAPPAYLAQAAEVAAQRARSAPPSAAPLGPYLEPGYNLSDIYSMLPNVEAMHPPPDAVFQFNPRSQSAQQVTQGSPSIQPLPPSPPMLPSGNTRIAGGLAGSAVMQADRPAVADSLIAQAGGNPRLLPSVPPDIPGAVPVTALDAIGDFGRNPVQAMPYAPSAPIQPTVVANMPPIPRPRSERPSSPSVNFGAIQASLDVPGLGGLGAASNFANTPPPPPRPDPRMAGWSNVPQPMPSGNPPPLIPGPPPGSLDTVRMGSRLNVPFFNAMQDMFGGARGQYRMANMGIFRDPKLQQTAAQAGLRLSPSGYLFDEKGHMVGSGSRPDFRPSNRAQEFGYAPGQTALDNYNRSVGPAGVGEYDYNDPRNW